MPVQNEIYFGHEPPCCRGRRARSTGHCLRLKSRWAGDRDSYPAGSNTATSLSAHVFTSAHAPVLMQRQDDEGAIRVSEEAAMALMVAEHGDGEPRTDAWRRYLLDQAREQACSTPISPGLLHLHADSLS